MRVFLLLGLAVFLLLRGVLPAAEPLFRKDDVIALVGAEDMVVASEYGYLELLLVRALPAYRLRFRNLAWEGDTVFEQRRDLGFPTWEEQLEKIGATVVICQFGQMESLMGTGAPGFPASGRVGVPPAEPGILPGGLLSTTPAASPEVRSGETPKPAGGTPTLPGSPPSPVAEFIAAYEKLIERFSAGGKRRVILFPPFAYSQSRPDTKELAEQLEPNRWLEARNPALQEQIAALKEAAPRWKASVLDVSQIGLVHAVLQRDGIHLTEDGHRGAATRLGLTMALPENVMFPNGLEIDEKHQALRQLIIAKNRLWFDYWRPQNWAFLNGDRTAQPSSRDHLDPSKRWFPPEREAFLPLIEAKEKEIDALAAQLAPQ